MDYVYLCRDGENEELRYSIRSLEANLPNANIWVVGGKPDWYTGNHTRVFQHSHKYQNAKKNLSAIVKNKHIGDSFVLMNDDFYVLEPLEKIPNLHGGYLKDKIQEYESLRINSSYTDKLKKTNKKLIAAGIPKPLNYELHVPMLISKKSVQAAIYSECLWRSYHGNIERVGGEEIEDVKIYADNRKEKKDINVYNLDYPFLSSEDKSFNYLKKEILAKKFPKKSSLEK